MIDKSILLIVDDDIDLLRQLEFLLEDEFEKILIASSKSDASKLPIDRIGVFLVDVRLSVTDPSNTEGLELARDIRQKNSSAIIVMMSRYETEKYEALNRKEFYADCFLRKPFTMEEFVELITKIKEERGNIC